ncbi:hypothetical protein ACSTLO_00470, partial [Vibrio parahaemolyticus]
AQRHFEHAVIPIMVPWLSGAIRRTPGQMKPGTKTRILGPWCGPLVALQHRMAANPPLHQPLAVRKWLIRLAAIHVACAQCRALGARAANP